MSYAYNRKIDLSSYLVWKSREVEEPMLVKGGMKKGRAEVARDVVEAIFGGALVLVQKDR